MTRHLETLDCERARLAGSRALDATLEHDLQLALDEHLTGCADCRAAVAELGRADRAARDALADLRQAASSRTLAADTARDLLARAAAGERPGEITTIRRHGDRLRPAQWMIAAALLIGAGAMLAMLMYETTRREQPREVATQGEDPGDRPMAPRNRFGEALVSCEVDPRGIDVRWEKLHPGDVHEYWVERYDTGGEQVSFHDIEGESFRDTDIDPGEEYFYVVRERRSMGEEHYAYVGTASAAQDQITDDVRVRYLGGTRNAAILEITFTQAGEDYTARFPLEVGERVGGETTVAGKGLASFDTPYHLMAIDWVVERVVVDPNTGDPAREQSRCVRLSTPSGEALTLWIRD